MLKVTFEAAMDGYPLGKIRQELASEEDFLVSDNFSRIWAGGVSDWGDFQRLNSVYLEQRSTPNGVFSIQTSAPKRIYLEQNQICSG